LIKVREASCHQSRWDHLPELNTCYALEEFCEKKFANDTEEEAPRTRGKAKPRTAIMIFDGKNGGLSSWGENNPARLDPLTEGEVWGRHRWEECWK